MIQSDNMNRLSAFNLPQTSNFNNFSSSNNNSSTNNNSIQFNTQPATTTFNKSLENSVNLNIPPSILQLSKTTGYPIKQHNGQRTFGPHVSDSEIPPPRGCEIFVGKIPRDLYEDELVPLFETIGKIYKMRLMMDFDGRNRGYCFITYKQKSHAQLAISKFNNYEIRKGRYLGVCCSVDNCRLFIGGIPKNKSREEIKTEIRRSTEGVKEVIVYLNPADSTKNRGFAFIEYENHRLAAMARRKLAPGKVLIFNTQVAVDWAEPEDETDDQIMSKVKILYVRNISNETSEEAIFQVFKHFGDLERVKKLRDYAFVHFGVREDALNAINGVNGKLVDGYMWEVTLAKPVTDKIDNSKMAMVGAKALAAAQAGVDPEMLQATQTANYLLQGGNTQNIPDLIHTNPEETNNEMNWQYKTLGNK